MASIRSCLASGHSDEASCLHLARDCLAGDLEPLHTPCLDTIPACFTSAQVNTSASKSSIRRLVIMEKAPTRAFSWLKAATTAFTFKTLC